MTNVAKTAACRCTDCACQPCTCIKDAPKCGCQRDCESACQCGCKTK